MMRSLAAAILLCVSAPAMSGDKDFGGSVQDLLEKCHGRLGSPQDSYCLGFIAAIAETWQSYCPGRNSSLGAAERAFVVWAEKNPKFWGAPDAAGVQLALTETWPCSEQK